MGVRVWIDPTKIEVETYANGHGRCIVLDGVRQSLDQEGCLYYFHTGLYSPINPKLRRGILKVTFQDHIEDGQHRARILCGEYRHGQFFAMVQQRMVGNPSRPVTEVGASAPTISLMRRWIRHLLSGNDKPRVLYSTPHDYVPPERSGLLRLVET